MKLSSNVVSCTTGDPIPEDIKPYLDTINGTGFFFKNYIGTSDYGQGYVQYAANYPFNNYSYFAYQDHIPQNIDIIPTQDWSQHNITEYWLYQSQIIDINIEKSGNNYNYSINITNLNPAVNLWYGRTNNAIGFYDKVYPDGRYWEGISSNLASSTFHSECTDSLLNVFIHISKRFRNINIYVDGVLWSKANNTN